MALQSSMRLWRLWDMTTTMDLDMSIDVDVDVNVHGYQSEWAQYM